MAVDFDSFVRWAESRFDSVVVKGNEVRINSIFAEDSKHHLWCNPYGGKHERADGCYRCFKTDKRGTLVGLVMLVEGCSYSEAKEVLDGGTPISILEARLEKMFEEEEKPQPKPKNALELPPESYLITSLPKSDLHRMEAENYLAKRKLPAQGLYYCTGGEYRHRIVIPYLDRNGGLMYFNARHVGKSELRYMGPDKKVGIGKSEVIYMPLWPPAAAKVYVTEGEFDALTLTLCGLYAAACGGKVMSEKQMLLLQGYRICLALDADAAGLQGLMEMSGALRKTGFWDLTYVRPHKDYKDWNKMLVVHHKELVRAYVDAQERPFDDLMAVNEQLKNQL